MIMNTVDFFYFFIVHLLKESTLLNKGDVMIVLTLLLAISCYLDYLVVRI